ncbi:hypothetical protein JOL62DRAFT_507955 [Phyllosticta paracitricarpa]|uniref:histone deacetylase n=1 Tax=Phyllosticta paracitricarpa TaxID=2016321 RepID=A0ABR1MXW9_9PEZI
MYIDNESHVLKSTETNGAASQTVDPSFLSVGTQSLKSAGEAEQTFPPTTQDENFDAYPEVPDEVVASDSSSAISVKSEEYPEAYPTYRQRAFVVINKAPPPKSKALPYSSSRTGLVYDVRMRFHTEPLDAMLSEDDIHPEDPRRIMEIFNELGEAGLVETPQHHVADPDFALWRIDARKATREEVCLVHTPEHYEWVANLSSKSQEELNLLAGRLDSIYLHPATFSCASLSAGGAIEACRAVVAGHVRNAVAVIRPPGHHAEHDHPGGFCFFNNVSIAARVCQEDFGSACRKILILDWDVHHGNGVQRAFYDDPNVLYISIHVHMNGTFYPMNSYGDHTHCGEGKGEGRNINIPWSQQGMGDGDYLYAFQQIVMPIAQEFNPDLVIVAAGFDAAKGDRLGMCEVTPPCYAHMTHMLMSLAQGKIVVCLEGGYNLQSIAKSTVAVTRTLMGEPPDRLDDDVEPRPLGQSTVELVKRWQSKYWKCMHPKKNDNQVATNAYARRIHDIVRQADSAEFWESFRMTELFILRDRISKSFEKQVLATHNFAEPRPLLIIFHEPPETTAMTDPQSAKLSLHNIFVTDVTKTYIAWAVKNGFGVIDVNIPEHITDPDMPPEFVEPASPDERAALTRELATYLWDNYISLGDTTHKFFMGVGAPYSGILDLLGEKGMDGFGCKLLCSSSLSAEECQEETDHVFAFVGDQTLPSIKRPTDDYIPSWYHSHSSVFVVDDHPAFDPSRQRRLRKRFGNVTHSPHTTIPNMLEGHRDEVLETMREMTEDWCIEQEEHKAKRQRAAEAAASSSSADDTKLKNLAAVASNASRATSEASAANNHAGAGSGRNTPANPSHHRHHSSYGGSNGGGSLQIDPSAGREHSATPRSTPAALRSPHRPPPMGTFTITPNRGGSVRAASAGLGGNGGGGGSGSASPAKRVRGE